MVFTYDEEKGQWVYGYDVPVGVRIVYKGMPIPWMSADTGVPADVLETAFKAEIKAYNAEFKAKASVEVGNVTANEQPAEEAPAEDAPTKKRQRKSKNKE